MRPLKRFLFVLPWLLLAGFIVAGTAQAAGHEAALDGLVQTLKAMVDAFIEYLNHL